MRARRLFPAAALLALLSCSSPPQSSPGLSDVDLKLGWNGASDGRELADDVAGNAEGDARSDGRADSAGPLDDTWHDADAAGQTDDAAGDSSGSDGALADSQADVVPEVTETPIEDVVCLFVPEVGEFSPVLECFYDDPLEKPNHDDVVMTPVVANLTDDDQDRKLSLKDTPDIAFLTYRVEEDGCCNSPAVLRVVSGKCEGGATGQGDDVKRLHEHFYIDTPVLDNSSGLAIGDVNADGRPEIVAMKLAGGTVAFSSVLYDGYVPTALHGQAAGWAPAGAADLVQAVTEEMADENTTMDSTVPGSQALFQWLWPLTSKAIATVRVEAWVMAEGDPASLLGVVSDGNAAVKSEPVQVLPAEGYRHVVFEFPKNPLSGGLQWTNENLGALRFGVESAGEPGCTLHVTKLELVVGHVEQLWSVDNPVKGVEVLTAAQPALADLEKDGDVEIVIGRVVLSGKDGQLKWKGKHGLGTNSFFGPISIAADIDLDGSLEVIAGNTAYSSSGDKKWTFTFPENPGCKSENFPCDGFGATGDFDDDEQAEVALVRRGILYLLEHDGTLKVRIPLPVDDCDYNEGGPPTVADSYGDAHPEIGAAGADFYVVFDLDCCDSFPDCKKVPPGSEGTCKAPGIRWSVPNFDCSSRVTGSSVFDFDGDGKAEVIYNDEEHFRVFRGEDGVVLLELPNTSHTRLEYPVVTDTDSDGNAEIVIIENGADSTPLQVWGDQHDAWVPTRRIWNQHTYHITNVTEDGLMPAGGETPNWLTYNNFRQNLPDFDPFLAPDLAVSVLAPDLTGCPGKLVLKAQVCNVGQLWVPPGVGIYFFDTAGQELLSCTKPPVTPVTLYPGECIPVTCPVALAKPLSEPMEYRACADDFTYPCAGPGLFNECNEGNNLVQGVAGPCE